MKRNKGQAAGVCSFSRHRGFLYSRSDTLIITSLLYYSETHLLYQLVSNYGEKVILPAWVR